MRMPCQGGNEVLDRFELKGVLKYKHNATSPRMAMAQLTVAGASGGLARKPRGLRKSWGVWGE